MRMASLGLAALLLASCGSSGGLGDISDIILGSPSQSQPSDVRGTVTYVDTGARRIDLDVSYINNLRNTSDSQRGSIYYDDRTRVVFQGRDYKVADERVGSRQ